MSSKAAKLAPLGVVAGALGYLCWPYLDDPAPPAAKAKTATAELTAALLSPPAAPPLSRDPFGSEAAADKLAASKPDRKAGPADRVAPVSAQQATAEAPSAKPSASAPSTLVLNGTYVGGKHRVAIINQAVYGEGDRITSNENAAAGWSVSRVGIDCVMLEFEGETAALSYPELNSPKPAPLSDSSKATGSQPRPRGKTTASSAKK